MLSFGSSVENKYWEVKCCSLLKRVHVYTFLHEFTFVDGFSKFSYRLAISQVKFHAKDIFIAWAFNDFFHSSLCFLHVPACYDDFRPYTEKNKSKSFNFYYLFNQVEIPLRLRTSYKSDKINLKHKIKLL